MKFIKVLFYVFKVFILEVCFLIFELYLFVILDKYIDIFTYPSFIFGVLFSTNSLILMLSLRGTKANQIKSDYRSTYNAMRFQTFISGILGFILIVLSVILFVINLFN